MNKAIIFLSKINESILDEAAIDHPNSIMIKALANLLKDTEGVIVEFEGEKFTVYKDDKFIRIIQGGLESSNGDMVWVGTTISESNDLSEAYSEFEKYLAIVKKEIASMRKSGISDKKIKTKLAKDGLKVHTISSLMDK